MESEKHLCEDCGRSLITIQLIAAAQHSGCAVLGYRHDLDECPSKAFHMKAATVLWKRMDKLAHEAG